MVSVARRIAGSGSVNGDGDGTKPAAEKLRSRFRIVVIRSGKEWRFGHEAGFDGSAGWVEIAVAGMSTVVAVSSDTG